jgi:very-short-patch-repair endonuclease
MGEGENRKFNMHYTKKLFAQELRKDSTPEEKTVWGMLRNRRFKDLKFRRQHILQGFVVDFYCHELRLAIEIDGKVHQKQLEYDALRQILIEEKGIRFLRITNEEINKDVRILLHKIEDFLPPPLPSRS